MATARSSIVRTLSDEKARSVVEARRLGSPTKLLARDCGTIEAGAGWDSILVDNACPKLLGLLDQLEEKGSKVDVFNFDRTACSLMHKEMQLPPKVAASDGFWRWLAVDKLERVIEARHRHRNTGVAHLGNYGIDNPSNARNRLKILWLRADLLYDSTADQPYHLAEMFLHSDFIESGIIRPRYGWCRNLARALVGFQYRCPKSNRVHLHSTDPSGIRELYKRLRHLHSVYAFEFMSDQELRSVLDNHSRDLKPAQ